MNIISERPRALRVSLSAFAAGLLAALLCAGCAHPGDGLMLEPMAALRGSAGQPPAQAEPRTHTHQREMERI